jgi:hypothetical protein
MGALVSESRGCKANRYVLVSTGDLQPRDAEWKDIALRRQDGRVEEQLSGCSASRSSAYRCLHINALQIAVLQIAALQINDCDQFFSLDSLKPVRTCSAVSNENPQPFVWTATVEAIMEKLSRCRQTSEKIQPRLHAIDQPAHPRRDESMDPLSNDIVRGAHSKF